MANIAWPAVLDRAADIVRSYDTPVTLRQLFYRLVSIGLIPNTKSAYVVLSDRTTTAREEGWFPALMDRGRVIHELVTFDSGHDALKYTADTYLRDRTDGQPWSVYLGVEKNGLVAQLSDWFDDYGIRVLALGGYGSHTYKTEVREHVHNNHAGRPAVLLYAGDFDPSGEDIDRDFIAKTQCWDKVVRVALTSSQVQQYDLPEYPGKATDTRTAGFVARHGRSVQVEVDALPPDVLRGLFQDAIDEFVDVSTFDNVVRREHAVRVALQRLVEDSSL